MSIRRKKILIILLLSFIGYLLHRPFFDFSTILFSSDRTHRSSSAVKDLLFKGLMTWQSQFGFGEEFAQTSFFGFKLIWGLIGEYDNATKVTFFIPLALLSFISPFILSCYLTKDNLIVSTVTSLFYGTITYLSVKTTAHLPIAMVFVLAPLIITFFHHYITTISRRSLLFFNIFYFLGIIYEVRIMFIISIILLISFIFFSEKQSRKPLLYGIFITLGLQLSLNAYRLLPVLHLSGEAISQATSRGLFGDNLFNLSYAITNFESSRTGLMPTQSFTPQPIPLYMRFYPFVLLLGFLYTKGKQKRLFLWGCGLFLCGVMLTKQSAAPIPGLYQRIFDNVPGFNLFREASKFYQITSLGYLIILSVVWDSLRKKHKDITTILLSISVIISSILAYPLLTGSIGFLRKEKFQPIEYASFATYLKAKSQDTKTLWIPFFSQRAEYSIIHPKIPFSQTTRSTWKQVYKEKETYSLTGKIAVLTNDILDRGNIQYVLVPLQDVSKNDYNSSNEEIVATINNLPFLERIDDSSLGFLPVYANTGMYGEVFSISGGNTLIGCDWQKMKSSEVIFSCTQANSSVTFSQQYNKQRRVYLGSPHRREILWGIVKPIAIPQKEYDGLMKFSFTVEAGTKYTLYFIPEAWFMLGIVISCLGICIVLGIFFSNYFIKNRNN